MTTLAKIILNNTNTYNGHNQMEIEGFTWKMSDVVTLMEELQTELEDAQGYLGCVVLNMHTDGSASVVAGDYWSHGQHELGHKDKVLLGLTIDLEGK